MEVDATQNTYEANEIRFIRKHKDQIVHKAQGLECYQDIATKDHGRYETREYRIMSNKDEIATIIGDKWEHVLCKIKQ